MKRLRLKEVKTLYRCNRLGHKIEQPIEVLVSYLEPESEEEADQVQALYRAARDKHLIFLDDLAGKIAIQERLIDEFNKRQIILADDLFSKAMQKKWWRKLLFSNSIPAETLDRLLISKKDIHFLLERCFDLISIIEMHALAFPMKEWNYTTLIDIDYFVGHLHDVYQEIIMATELNKQAKRHQLLNVTF